jgi:uncharacterized membrane protein YbaN (DUF454 family)
MSQADHVTGSTSPAPACDRAADASGARRSLPARVGWAGLGVVAVGVGGVGIVVPGLPTTVFFVIAAWAFARSNPRWEAWVLGLPRVGPLVRDYRAGVGMPYRAKVTAAAMMVVFVGVSAWMADGRLLRIGLVAAGVVGLVVVLCRVPTKEPSPTRPEAC